MKNSPPPTPQIEWTARFNNGNGGQASLELTGVTLSANDAGHSGGALYNNGNDSAATAELVNSTLSGNSAGINGGGIVNLPNGGTAALTLHFVTLAGNSAKKGGALFNNAGGTINLSATLLVAGEQGKACDFSGGASLNSGGYNLDSDGSCGLAGTGDIAGGTAALAALALNAPGDTATHALGADSDAQRRIPSGAAGCGGPITTDQRGAPRPLPGTLCDIGAYESDADAPSPVRGGVTRPAKDQEARQRAARLLGHNRPGVTSCYLGRSPAAVAAERTRQGHGSP